MPRIKRNKVQACEIGCIANEQEHSADQWICRLDEDALPRYRVGICLESDLSSGNQTTLEPE